MSFTVKNKPPRQIILGKRKHRISIPARLTYSSWISKISHIMAERSRIWIRARLPDDLHRGLKSQAEEQQITIRELLMQFIRSGLSESSLLENLIKFFDDHAADIKVKRRAELLSLTWNSDGQRRRLIYDSSNDELIQV